MNMNTQITGTNFVEQARNRLVKSFRDAARRTNPGVSSLADEIEQGHHDQGFVAITAVIMERQARELEEMGGERGALEALFIC